VNSKYPSDWDSRRKNVYRRDNYTCQNCGAKGGPKGHHELHAHHIVPKSKGGTHKLSNLKTVCSRCHKAIHGNSIAPTGNGRKSHNSDKEREATESLFVHSCPICNSPDIGVGKDNSIIQCQRDSCQLRLKRNPNGLSVQHINKGLLEEGSPLRKADNYTLAEPAWYILAEKDRDEEVNYRGLEQQSKDYNQRMQWIKESKILVYPFVASCIGILILLNIFLPTIIAWGVMLLFLIGLAIGLYEYDKEIKIFVFKSVS
jgi:hypothetical protein